MHTAVRRHRLEVQVLAEAPVPHWSVAQQSERRAHNPEDAGAIPAGPTNSNKAL